MYTHNYMPVYMVYTRIHVDMLHTCTCRHENIDMLHTCTCRHDVDILHTCTCRHENMSKSMYVLHKYHHMATNPYVCIRIHLAHLYPRIRIYMLHTCIYMLYMHTCMHFIHRYGVATMSRLLKITGLFCRISYVLQGSFVKETYDFKEPTNRSHPILSRGKKSLYGVATISRLLKIILLFCKRDL